MVDRIALYRESDLQDFYVDQVAIAKNPTSSTDSLGKKQIKSCSKYVDIDFIQPEMYIYQNLAMIITLLNSINENK